MLYSSIVWGSNCAAKADQASQKPQSVELASSALLTLGGKRILRLFGTVGGANPDERIDAVNDRLLPIISHPDLLPSDVIVYAPPAKSPVIYVLGRSIVTVDKWSAMMSGFGTQLKTAVAWAKNFQQILPLVDIRLRNEAEPIIPPDPPLLVTSDFTQVGGAIGEVDWNGKLVISIGASPIAGQTPAQYADIIQKRLASELNAAADPVSVSVVPVPDDPNQSVDVMIGQARLITATLPEAVADGLSSPLTLAEIWAGNLQVAVR